MRKSTVIFVVTATLVLSGCVTPPDPEFHYVREFDGLSAERGYDLSLQWMAETYVSSQEVVQLSDSERGIIIGRGADTFQVGPLNFIRVRYMIRVEHREDRARLTIAQPRDIRSGPGSPLENDLQIRAFEGDVAERVADSWERYLRTYDEEMAW